MKKFYFIFSIYFFIYFFFGGGEGIVEVPNISQSIFEKIVILTIRLLDHFHLCYQDKFK